VAIFQENIDIDSVKVPFG